MKLISLILVLVMSGAGVLQTLLYVRLKKRFQSWPVISAEVTDSRLLDQLGPDGEELLEAVIYFKFYFRGKEYEVNTPALRGYDLFPSRSYEAELVKKYRTGERYNVRVFPAAPKLAYLEVAPLSKLSTILAPLLSIGGVCILYLYFKGFFGVLGGLA